MKDHSIDISKLPPVYEGNEDYIFISYSHRDVDIVYADLWKLYESGVRYWYDKGLPAGKEWDGVIESKIKDQHCKGIIFYLSQNIFLSDSIEREMNFCFYTSPNNKRKKDFFAVHIAGKTTMDMLLAAMLQDKSKITTARSTLITGHFTEKSTHINREQEIDNFDHLENILENLVLFNVINEDSKRALMSRKKIQGALVVCKGSVFSKSIVQGINENLASKPNIALDINYIDRNLPNEFAEAKFIKIIEDNTDNYDAFILRPVDEISEECFIQINKIIAKNKKIIIIDISLTEEQKSRLSKEKNIRYIGSDFHRGGQLIGEKINELIELFGKLNSKVIVFEGPYIKQSIKERCESIKIALQDEGNDDVCSYILTKSLNEKELLTNFRSWLQQNYTQNEDMDGQNLIIFSGNDNCAKGLAQNLLEKNANDSIYNFCKPAKSITLLGYDGVRDANEEHVLGEFGIDYYTADVLPFKQGIIIGDMLNDMLFSSNADKDKLVAPLLVGKAKNHQIKIKTIRDIKYLFKNKRLLLFDLDGTIADTETLHWEAYNILLSKQGIYLKGEDISKYIGNSEVNIYDMIRNDFGAVINTEQFLKDRISIYLKLVKEKELKPYSYFLEILEVYGDMQMALLTSQVPYVIDELLEYWELDKYFPKERRLSAHDGKITKKQVFDNISDYIKINNTPLTCNDVLAFEDSNHVMALVKNANMLCIGIEHKYNIGKINYCDVIISQSLTVGLFIGLCGEDIVYRIPSIPPGENTKIKTNKFHVNIGGPAANAAQTFALLGGKAILVSCIGNSPNGQKIKNQLSHLNITVIDLADVSFGTPNISCIFVNETNGNRTVVSGQRNLPGSPKRDFENEISKIDFCLYDCNLPFFLDHIIPVLNKYKVPIILDAGSWKDGIQYWLENASEVISSENFQDKAGRDIFEIARLNNIASVAKTRGAKTIEYSDNKTVGEISPIVPNKILNTLGAGDVFHGAFCYYRYQGKQSFISSLQKAMQVATYTISYYRAIEGVFEFIKQDK